MTFNSGYLVLNSVNKEVFPEAEGELTSTELPFAPFIRAAYILFTKAVRGRCGKAISSPS